MEINAIRMNNYRTLFARFRASEQERDTPEHGIHQRFADHCRVSVRYLAHITHGRKKFSESMARQLEDALGLPLGWMDNVHSAQDAAGNDAEREFVDLAMTLYRENPVEMQRMMMQFMLQHRGSGRR